MFLAAPLFAQQALPKPDKYFTDKAGVIPTSQATALNEKLAEFERDTSNQLLVYIDRSLPPNANLEMLANESFRQWGVGQKDKSNGAILFVFIEDRKMRIEVGRGLEGPLPDARTRDITTAMKPYFKSGDYPGGVSLAVDSMIAATKGEYHGTGSTRTESRSDLSVSVKEIPTGVWIIIAIFGLVVLLIIFTIVMTILKAIAKGIRNGFSRASSSPGSTTTWSSNDSSSSWSSSSSDYSSSSSDSSSSSSDFSGGGGDSGGGGSSDSW